MRVPFQINSYGKTLLGVLHITQRQLDIPVVIIMCYGLNGNRVEQHRMSVKFGDLCEKNSFNFVRFDYANVGVSEGDFYFSSIDERVKNLISIYKFIRGCFNSNISVYLIGFSDGAKIALHSMEYIEYLSGIILWNPIINVPTGSISQNSDSIIKDKLKLHKKYKKPYKPLFGACLNMEMVKELNTDNSISKLNTKLSTMFVFGEMDKFTKNIRLWVEKNNFKKSHIEIIKNSGHLFGHSALEKDVNEKTIEWIKEQEK